LTNNSKLTNSQAPKKHPLSYRLLLAEIVLFILLYILSKTVFAETYLFAWAAHRWYRYVFFFMPAALFALYNKYKLSISLLVGTVVGLFTGNYLGDYIVGLNKAKIAAGAENLSNEQIYRLSHHPGFEIWIGIVLAALLVGLILEVISESRKK
jgi:hypothetical protein